MATGQAAEEKSARGGWRRWVWLVSLAVWTTGVEVSGSSCHAEAQTDLSLDVLVKPACRDASTLTRQARLPPVSDASAHAGGLAAHTHPAKLLSRIAGSTLV